MLLTIEAEHSHSPPHSLCVKLPNKSSYKMGAKANRSRSGQLMDFWALVLILWRTSWAPDSWRERVRTDCAGEGGSRQGTTGLQRPVCLFLLPLPISIESTRAAGGCYLAHLGHCVFSVLWGLILVTSNAEKLISKRRKLKKQLYSSTKRKFLMVLAPITLSMQVHTDTSACAFCLQEWFCVTCFSV